MSKYTFEAIIFDLDGVITKTASVHSRAWKKMFDEYLKQWSKENNKKFNEFTHVHDYLPYVDGKPRYKGVNDFLVSRGINLPYGTQEDSENEKTVCGLGNRKNQAFNQVLEEEGVEVFESTVVLMKQAIASGIKVGVASSSKNCKNVLKAANLTNLVETRVDGIVSAEIGLKGKPEPDIFTTACDNLGVRYNNAIVVEDAVSGVAAGKAGNFGLVLGVARENNKNELLINGADIVVSDIAEIGLNDFEDWFTNGLKKDKWSLKYYDYSPQKEKSRESLLTVGNGYFGTRGAMEENDAGQNNYPGTYIAGVYNRLKSKVADKIIENEDFVNCPNWLPITFMINSDSWFDINKATILEYKKSLNLKNGLLSRSIIVQDKKGRETKIYSERVASMANPNLAAIKYSVTPMNYSGIINFKVKLDGNIINEGVERYKSLNQKHLQDVSEGFEDNYSWIVSKTTQSNIEIAEVSRIEFAYNNIPKKIDILSYIDKNSVISEIEADVHLNETATIEKAVSIFSSNNSPDDPLSYAKTAAINADNFDTILASSEKEWQKIWNEIDIEIKGDRLAQKLLRIHLYHLIVSMSPHNSKLDASITARGLHGEAYRGHVFWDELFILPFYNIHFPETAKAMLLYRYRRLDKAKENAGKNGYKGAMFPWQSGSDGREETQIIHLNPLTGKWGDDYSSLQRHVSLAIAYNVWHYFNTTEDIDFMNAYGSEMFFEIVRFWVSKAEFNSKSQKYEIKNVMGPNEFHEKSLNSPNGGLKDNAYTNIMVSWMLSKAMELINLLDADVKKKIFEKISIEQNEIDKWNKISKRLNIVISKAGIISQYDGYFNLKELDWNAYREKYKNIHRMDRILKAEGKSPDEYKVSKQADTLMAFYNLTKQETDTVFKNLEYVLPSDYLDKNLDYYLNRTSHGSTLSKVVHAQLANIIGNKSLSSELYFDALTSDFIDVQGGTTAEGIHTGVMAGTIMIALNTYGGVDFRSGNLEINPSLPVLWKKMNFSLRFKQVKYYIEQSKIAIKIKPESTIKESVDVIVLGKNRTLKMNKLYEFVI